MSRGTIIAIGAVILVIVIGVATLYTALQPGVSEMIDGPGMLYFYSET